jgi:SAM-dependent methyltransferase
VALPSNGDGQLAQSSGTLSTLDPRRSGLLERVPSIPPPDLRRSLYGPVGRFVKQGIDFLLSYHTYYQRSINLSLTQFLRELTIDHDALRDQVGQYTSLPERLLQTETTLARLAASCDETVARLEQAERVPIRLEERLGQLERRVERVAVAEALEGRLNVAEARIAHTNYRFAARPYMSSDVFGSQGTLDRPMSYGASDDDPANPLRDQFANLFRGREDFIASRQRVYLPFFEGRDHVVDLGCGRGEFLGLLASQNVAAIGVELDLKLVDACRAKGYHVVYADVADYLRSVQPLELDGIFSAQVLEHLALTRIRDILELSRSRLRPNGIFVAETVNPECYEALKTFYVDLTHVKPIFPQVMLQLCADAGFTSAQIFYPNAGGFTQKHYEDSGEYAVIAYTYAPELPV